MFLLLLTIKAKANQGEDACNQSSKDMGVRPGIDSASPRAADQEQYHSAKEEEESAEVQLFNLLPLGLAMNM